MLKKTTITFSLLEVGESGREVPYKNKKETTIYYLLGFIPVYKTSVEVKQTV